MSITDRRVHATPSHRCWARGLFSRPRYGCRSSPAISLAAEILKEILNRRAPS